MNNISFALIPSFFFLFFCVNFLPPTLFVFAHKQYMGLHIYIPLTQHEKNKQNNIKKTTYKSEFW